MSVEVIKNYVIPDEKILWIDEENLGRQYSNTLRDWLLISVFSLLPIGILFITFFYPSMYNLSIGLLTIGILFSSLFGIVEIYVIRERNQIIKKIRLSKEQLKKNIYMGVLTNRRWIQKDTDLVRKDISQFKNVVIRDIFFFNFHLFKSIQIENYSDQEFFIKLFLDYNQSTSKFIEYSISTLAKFQELISVLKNNFKIQREEIIRQKRKPDLYCFYL